jgi:hypothetical protein
MPIALGNGSQIVGSEIADNTNGSAFLDEFIDNGTYGDRVRHDQLFKDADFPTIGESIDVNLVFILNPALTLVNTAFLNDSGGAVGSALGSPQGLEFLLMSDNDPGELYQLNSLSISSNSLTTVPEPSPLFLSVIGLAGLVLANRKVKRT